MRKLYYNTNNVSGQQLLDFEQGAKSQEDLVLCVYKTALRPLAWNEVRELLDKDMNEVSLKRSISNLSKNKKDLLTGEITEYAKITKTEEMVQGPYGKPCHRYRLI